MIKSCWTRTIGVLAVSSSLLSVNPATAEVYKCTDAEGNLSFSDIPCKTDSESEVFTLGTSTPSTGYQPGKIPDNWRGYCVATFNQDTSVQAQMGEETIDIKQGDKFLVSMKLFNGTAISFLYFTDKGVVHLIAANENLDFNCDNSKSVFAAFFEVDFYADDELKQKACHLKAGESIDISGAYSVGGGIGLSETVTVYIKAASFAKACNGHEKVYYQYKTVDIGYSAPAAIVQRHR